MAGLAWEQSATASEGRRKGARGRAVGDGGGVVVGVTAPNCCQPTSNVLLPPRGGLLLAPRFSTEGDGRLMRHVSQLLMVQRDPGCHTGTASLQCADV